MKVKDEDGVFCLVPREIKKVSLRKENDMVQDIDINPNEYYCLILMERL